MIAAGELSLADALASTSPRASSAKPSPPFSRATQALGEPRPRPRAGIPARRCRAPRGPRRSIATRRLDAGRAAARGEAVATSAPDVGDRERRPQPARVDRRSAAAGAEQLDRSRSPRTVSRKMPSPTSIVIRPSPLRSVAPATAAARSRSRRAPSAPPRRRCRRDCARRALSTARRWQSAPPPGHADARPLPAPAAPRLTERPLACVSASALAARDRRRGRA